MATLPSDPPSSAQIADHQRVMSAEHASFAHRLQQAALDDEVDYFHQPGFIEEFTRLTGEGPLTEIDIHIISEGRREPRWNFTADDRSFTE